MRERSRWRSAFVAELGVTGQAAAAAALAWGASVAPCAWSRSLPAKALAVAALAVLVAGLVAERLSVRADASRVHPLVVWGFATLSAATWVVAPQSLDAAHLSYARVASSVVGWALFAHACAAPALEPTSGGATEPQGGSEANPWPWRGTAIIGTAFVFALGLLVFGAAIAVAERSVLVESVAVACGLGLIGSAGVFAVGLERSGTRPSQAAFPYARLSLVVILLATGVFVSLAR